MSQVYVSPNSDASIGTVSIIVVILTLVILGIMAYSRGWLFMSPKPVAPTPGSNINMTLSAPSTAAPTATPTPTPAPADAPASDPADAPVSAPADAPTAINYQFRK